MTDDLLANLLRELASAPTPVVARQALRRVADPDGLLKVWAKRLLQMARTDPVSARSEARQACVLAARASDATLCRGAWRSRAGVELLGGRPRSARRALQRARRGAPLPERARSAVLSAHVLGELGAFEEAQAALEEVRHLAFEQGGVQRVALIELAEVSLLERQERFPEALVRLEDIDARLAGEHEESIVLLSVRSNLANVLTQLSEYERADATYQWIERRHEERGELLSVLQTAYNRTYIAALRGQYRAALADLLRLEARARELGDERHAAHCALDRAEIELRLGLATAAEASAEAAAATLLRLGHERDAARACWFRGVALLARGAGAEAIQHLRDATERLARVHSPVWAALGDHQLAVALRREGHEDAAAGHARRAAQSLYRLGLVERGGQAELLEATLERDRGWFERSLERLDGLDARLRDTYAPWLRCDLEYGKACCYEGLGNTAAAREHVLAALDLLERFRLGVPPDEYMSSFLDQRAQVAEHAVRLLAAADDEDPAVLFRVIEGAKSRALLDMLRAGRHRSVGVGEPAEAQLDALEREIDGLGRLRWNEDRRVVEAEAKRREVALEVRHRRLRASLDALAEDESAASSWHRGPVGLDEAREALDEDTTLLTLHVGQGALVLGVLDAEGFHVRSRSFGTWHAKRLVRRLAFHLDRPAVVLDAYTEASHRLVSRAEEVLAEAWQALVAPVLERLERKRLVIVPHGPLHAVPFHALLPGPGEAPLLASHDITTAPSISVYVHARRRDPGRLDRVEAFGVPDADAPLVEEEALAVAALWPSGRAHRGPAATRAALLAALASPSIVHVASHGVFDDDDPLRAGIRLGDGWLRTSDLYGRDVRSGLVILSGCVTGRIATRSADEPMGLVRGFLAAGARQLLNTLWHVTDRPTLDAMRAFHAQLAAGATPCEALRDAALRVRATHPHPAHWAPFALVGAHVDRSRS